MLRGICPQSHPFPSFVTSVRNFAADFAVRGLPLNILIERAERGEAGGIGEGVRWRRPEQGVQQMEKKEHAQEKKEQAQEKNNEQEKRGCSCTDSLVFIRATEDKGVMANQGAWLVSSFRRSSSTTTKRHHRSNR
ncbi:uncharacterized protein [Triticum aestivum]|uniref:uncharacterized protein n=1 Tax=Triticum aestivum TaxID=4565 RepID=UPI001D018143|nr:uncharacterized protein LOC123090450 [Triticum aestivum]